MVAGAGSREKSFPLLPPPKEVDGECRETLLLPIHKEVGGE